MRLKGSPCPAPTYLGRVWLPGRVNGNQDDFDLSNIWQCLEATILKGAGGTEPGHLRMLLIVFQRTRRQTPVPLLRRKNLEQASRGVPVPFPPCWGLEKCKHFNCPHTVTYLCVLCMRRLEESSCDLSAAWVLGIELKYSADRGSGASVC